MTSGARGAGAPGLGISASAAWSFTVVGVVALGALGVAQLLDWRGSARDAIDLRWRHWLRRRVTAEGADPAYRSGEHCPRCGDLQGTPHECRDLAR